MISKLITRTSGAAVFGLLPVFSIALTLAAPSAPGAAATNAPPFDGSFEVGSAEPDGWTLLTGASWAKGQSRGGSYSLSGNSKSDRRICESRAQAVPSGADYRLEGWIQCRAGEARLGLDLLDERGRAVSRPAAARIHAGSAWQYVALEINTGKATRARVWFRVKGQATLDDVALVSDAIAFMGNKGLEPDDRGRIPFWNEEKDDSVLKGRRAGELRTDTETKREGKASALVAAAGDWFGIASINYPLTPSTDTYELSAWTRCVEPASAMLLACWTDDQTKVLRVDQSAAVKSQDWQEIRLRVMAPTGASSVRLVGIAQGGRAWFDECGLRRLRSRERRLRVFVNQVGYDTAGPKTAIVASNFFPPDRTTLAFQLLGRDGQVAWAQDLSCSGRIYGGTKDDWGWYFWRADFSRCRMAGDFHAAAHSGKVACESAPFRIASGVLLEETARSAVDFFFVQRCGFDVPGWHKPCHLDDAKLPDGSHLDATGGWHSAGDYNKLMYEHGDGGVAFALLKAFQSAPAVFGRFDRNSDGMPDALDEALWGAQFVAKMQVPETRGLRNHVNQGPGRQWTKWSAPEEHTDNVAGTADDPIILAGEGSSPLVIGGWARLSRLLEQRGHTNEFLGKALRLWHHATIGGTNVGSAYLLLSALELHSATGQKTFLDAARRATEALLAQQVAGGRLKGAFGTYGDTTAAGLASFALACPEDSLIPKIREALGQYMKFCTAQADNAFGFSRQPFGETDQFFPPDMGNSFQVLSRAWAAALIHRLTRDPAALTFATDQVDWLLGKNPCNLCLFEGKGTSNPPRYHHRYNTIPGHERGAVPGTVPNGFVREMGMADRPGFDLSRGGNRAPSFRTSEPWLVHNLFYLLAVTELNAAVQTLPEQDVTPRGVSGQIQR